MNYINDDKHSAQDDDINLLDLLNVIWQQKIILFSSTFILSLLSVIYALLLPNIYISETLLTPAENNQSSMGGLGEYASVASLAGISLPSSSGDKSLEAIERIKSYDFFKEHILKSILLEDLLAVKNWDQESNKITYDQKLFNTTTNQWVRKVSFPKKTIPSDQEAYEEYLNIMSVKKNKNFITISIKHNSPFIAQKWNKNIIENINMSMREDEKRRTSKSIEFLNEQSNKVNYSEIKKAISSLLQEQIKSLMLIEANDEYIFKVVNSPTAPELKAEPKRSLIVILAALGGFILGLLYILIVNYLKINLRK